MAILFSPTKYAVPIPIRTIPIPIPIAISSPKMLPFPWKSHGNPMGMGILISMHTSSLHCSCGCLEFRNLSTTSRNSKGLRNDTARRVCGRVCKCWAGRRLRIATRKLVIAGSYLRRPWVVLSAVQSACRPSSQLSVRLIRTRIKYPSLLSPSRFHSFSCLPPLLLLVPSGLPLRTGIEPDFLC